MSIEQQIEQIEVSIKQAKEAVDLRNAVLRLTDNPDFKLVIREGYFKEEASRVVLLKADQEMQKPEDQRYLDNCIIAIGYLRLYLATIMQIGAQMERTIADDEVTREELLTEQE